MIWFHFPSVSSELECVTTERIKRQSVSGYSDQVFMSGSVGAGSKVFKERWSSCIKTDAWSVSPSPQLRVFSSTLAPLSLDIIFFLLGTGNETQSRFNEVEGAFNKDHCQSGLIYHDGTYLFIKHSFFVLCLLYVLFKRLFLYRLFLWFAACAVNEASCSCIPHGPRRSSMI